MTDLSSKPLESNTHKKVWHLSVWDVSPVQAGLMARLKMMPTKKNPTNFWRYYPNRPQVEAAIDLLKAAGLHGRAKLVDAPPSRPRFPRKLKLQMKHGTRSKTDRSGFGGRLNATPIKGTWRRKTKRRD
jgi:hypothetical protein